MMQPQGRPCAPLDPIIAFFGSATTLPRSPRGRGRADEAGLERVLEPVPGALT